MRMRKGIQRKEWLLLILPTLFLLGFGFYLQWSKEQPFELVAEKVMVASSSAIGGYDTHVTLVMISRGSWPRWLSEPSPPNGPVIGWGVALPVFYKQNGKRKEFIWPRGIKSRRTSGAYYDKNQRRFIANAWLNLAAIPKELGTLTCEMTATLEHVALPDNQGRRKGTDVASATNTVVVRP